MTAKSECVERFPPPEAFILALGMRSPPGGNTCKYYRTVISEAQDTVRLLEDYVHLDLVTRPVSLVRYVVVCNQMPDVLCRGPMHSYQAQEFQQWIPHLAGQTNQ